MFVDFSEKYSFIAKKDLFWKHNIIILDLKYID